MSIGVGIKIEAERTVAELKSLAGAFGDPSPVLYTIGQRLLGWVGQNFRAGGLEKPWAPLSPNTVAGRRAGGLKKSQGTVRFRGRNVVGAAVAMASAKPLQDTGRLRQSFVSKVFNLGAPYVEVGTQNQIAAFHEFGTSPYTIMPRQASRLVFMTAGGVAFARKVHHPGLKPRKMLPSETLTQRMGLETLNAALKKIVKDSGLAAPGTA